MQYLLNLMKIKMGIFDHLKLTGIGQLKKIEPPKSDFGSFEFKNPLEKTEKLSKKQFKKQSELLEFLKETTIRQSETAEKQIRNNFWMTGLALIFAFISITPIIEKLILPDESKKLYQNIYELEKRISLESKDNVAMYKNLLILESQVKILEKQNKKLKEKKTLK